MFITQTTSEKKRAGVNHPVTCPTHVSSTPPVWTLCGDTSTSDGAAAPDEGSGGVSTLGSWSRQCVDLNTKPTGQFPRKTDKEYRSPPSGWGRFSRTFVFQWFGTRDDVAPAKHTHTCTGPTGGGLLVGGRRLLSVDLIVCRGAGSERRTGEWSQYVSGTQPPAWFWFFSSSSSNLFLLLPGNHFSGRLCVCVSQATEEFTLQQ